MAEHDHMCAWACGNVADNVLINLNTSEADILCTPCFLRLANDISQQFLENLKAQEEVEGTSSEDETTALVAGTAEALAFTKADNAPRDDVIQLDTTPPPSDPNLPAAFR